MPDDAYKNIDEFIANLDKWANEDTDVILELMERMTGRPYVGKKEQDTIRRFLSNHIDLLAAVTLSLNKQREMVHVMQETSRHTDRIIAANDRLIETMKKFLPPDILDAFEKIK